MWPDRRVLDLLDIELPILLSPMGGAMDWELAAAVSEAGGLGSLPCALIDASQIKPQVEKYHARTQKPLNLNFFTHEPPVPNNAREAAWRDRLAPYYLELGLDPRAPVPSVTRAPFSAALCDILVEVRPAVASFHFGLPEPALLKRVKDAGCQVIGSATTVAEACWLEQCGADIIIAQGAEAGGHRGIFLSDDSSTQAGTFALIPQVVDSVKVPVVAAGGIADGRGIAAAFALGAAAVQIGTAYLHCPESRISAPHRAALKAAQDNSTTITNALTGRPARGIVNRTIRELGPMSTEVPAFPLAANALAPLRAAAEKQGSGDFSPLWSGQAAALGRALPAGELTQKLAADALACMRALSA